MVVETWTYKMERPQKRTVRQVVCIVTKGDDAMMVPNFKVQSRIRRPQTASAHPLNLDQELAIDTVMCQHVPMILG